jgi:hypothetical protein
VESLKHWVVLVEAAIRAREKMGTCSELAPGFCRVWNGKVSRGHAVCSDFARFHHKADDV